MKPLRCVTSFLLLFALGIGASASQAQTTPPAPPERVIINFVLPITPDTVNLLLGVVNAQMHIGVKKITIVLASSGGDPASGFAAYNILKSLPIEITTFNAGNIDSAAMLIYCAGKYRYSLPSPARFLIHSVALNPISTNFPVDRIFLESQLAQMNSLNQVMVQVIKENSKKTLAEVDAAVKGQTILSPEQAKDWGLVEEIRATFMEPGAVFAAVEPTEKPDVPKRGLYTTDNPVTSATQPETPKSPK
jgi:ATP-dependent Clp protease, protease subunit